jgi:hypothetical protein
MLTAQDVFAAARVMVDDPEGDAATDQYLVPLLQLTIDDMTTDILRNPNIGVLKAVVVLPGFPAGVTSFAAAGYFGAGTGQPGNGELAMLDSIITMREKAAGSADINYMPMTEMTDLPIVVQESFNQVYVHLQGSDILVPGATQANDVRIFGTFDQPTIQNQDTPIRPGTQASLKFGLAAAYCMARGNPKLAEGWDKKYQRAKNDLLNAIIMEQQQVPQRPKGFSDASGMIGSNFAW